MAAPGPRRWDRASAAPARPRREIPPPRPGGGGPRGAAPTPRSVKAASAPRSRDSAVPPAGSGMGWGGRCDNVGWDRGHPAPVSPISTSPLPQQHPQDSRLQPLAGKQHPTYPHSVGDPSGWEDEHSTAQLSLVSSKPQPPHAGAAPLKCGCTTPSLQPWGDTQEAAPQEAAGCRNPRRMSQWVCAGPGGQRSPRSSTHSLQCRAHCCFLNVKPHFAYNN